MSSKILESTSNPAELHDQLTGILIGLARAMDGNEYLVNAGTYHLLLEGLFAGSDHADFDNEVISALLARADSEKRRLVPGCYACAASCGKTDNYDIRKLQDASEEARTLKLQILSGIREAAVCILRANISYDSNEDIKQALFKALFSIGMDDWGAEELLPILAEVNAVHLKYQKPLDKTAQ